jgi:pimeloyl-ACP methyl ester carboxylesterase
MPLASKRVKKRLLSSLHETETPETEQKIGSIPAFRRATTTTLKPLIFVPGISASALAKKIKTNTNEEQWQYFWPPPWNLPPQEQNKIMLDGLLSDIRSNPDDPISVKAMGLYPLTYDYLINALELWGYRQNVNFWIFPYDWRQSNRISGKLLADFIRDNVSKSNSTQGDGGVDIISHSMGGFVTRAAALLYKAPINRAVYIASPHYGCPLSYFTLHTGIPYDEFPEFVNVPPVDDTLNRLFELTRLPANRINIHDPAVTAALNYNDQLEDAYRKFPSMYELLPDPFYLEAKPLLYSDNEPILGAEQTYLEGDWKFTEDFAISRVKDAMKFKKDELGQDLPPGDNLIIYGISEPTDDTIAYQTRFFVSGNKSKIITHDAMKMFSFPYDSGQEGDSWVPTLSGMRSMSGTVSQNSRSFIDTHTLLPNNIGVIKATLEFLSSSVT